MSVKYTKIKLGSEVTYYIEERWKDIMNDARFKVLYGICTESMKMPHGRGWAEIYRRLRKLTVNQMISYKEGE
jgi:hypothetical protein